MNWVINWFGIRILKYNYKYYHHPGKSQRYIPFYTKIIYIIERTLIYYFLRTITIFQREENHLPLPDSDSWGKTWALWENWMIRYQSRACLACLLWRMSVVYWVTGVIVSWVSAHLHFLPLHSVLSPQNQLLCLRLYHNIGCKSFDKLVRTSRTLMVANLSNRPFLTKKATMGADTGFEDFAR